MWSDPARQTGHERSINSQAAGRSPVDRGKQGTKRSLLTDANGIPVGCVIAGANKHDSPLLRPTLERLARFDEGLGFGLPTQITVHLDAGYDSTKTRNLLDELGCAGVISIKGFPLQAGARWVIERTNSWHNRGFKKLAVCTERRTQVIEDFIALANAAIITSGSSGPPGQPTAGKPAQHADPDLSAQPLSQAQTTPRPWLG